MNPTVIAAIIAAAASLGGPVLSCFLSRKAEVRAQKAEERAEAAEKEQRRQNNERPTLRKISTWRIS